MSGPAGARVSVVVATRDRPRRLEALIGSLARQTIGHDAFELIVVDDASGDPGAIAPAERSGIARLIRRAEGGGPGVARNDGWRAAAAPLVAFTDDDCEADPRWLERLLEVADANPGAVVQGRTEPIRRELDRLGPFARTLTIEARGPFFQTCNVLYPRALLERLGGFRPLRSGEDAELAWRAFEQGAAAAFAPGAVVRHAVVERGPVENLRFALRWSDSVYAYKRHPGLRRAVMGRSPFWRRSHRRLVLALAGLMLARRFPPAGLLTARYARDLAGRCRAIGASPAYAPYLALEDAVELTAMARGSLRFRTLVL